MTRRCSRCLKKGHNCRTCPTSGGGAESAGFGGGSGGTIGKKSADMGNLSSRSTEIEKDIKFAVALALNGFPIQKKNATGRKRNLMTNGAGSAGCGGSANHSAEREEGCPYYDFEHQVFLNTLQKLGEHWRDIDSKLVPSKTPSQVAHALKDYLMRKKNATGRKRNLMTNGAGSAGFGGGGSGGSANHSTEREEGCPYYDFEHQVCLNFLQKLGDDWRGIDSKFAVAVALRGFPIQKKNATGRKRNLMRNGAGSAGCGGGGSGGSANHSAEREEGCPYYAFERQVCLNVLQKLGDDWLGIDSKFVISRTASPVAHALRDFLVHKKNATGRKRNLMTNGVGSAGCGGGGSGGSANHSAESEKDRPRYLNKGATGRKRNLMTNAATKRKRNLIIRD